MDRRIRLQLAVAGTVGLFLLIQLGALALIEPFDTAGFNPVDDPQDPTTPLLVVGAIIVATALMLLAFKYRLESLIRAGVIGACVLLSWFALVIFIPPIVTVAGLNPIPPLLAIAIGFGLLIHPEWYVIDAAGVLIGATAAGLFGISFGILPAIVLLIVLSVYDAISVYGTKHMLSLAEGAMDVKIPVLLIIPITLSYSYLQESTESSANDESGERSDAQDALFIGLGDAVIPTIMIASAAFFAPAPPLDVPGLAINLPAVTAILGTAVGLLVLLRMVLKGTAHAGLPLLCGGTILGYLIGALIVGIPFLEAIGLAPYL